MACSGTAVADTAPATLTVVAVVAIAVAAPLVVRSTADTRQPVAHVVLAAVAFSSTRLVHSTVALQQQSARKAARLPSLQLLRLAPSKYKILFGFRITKRLRLNQRGRFFAAHIAASVSIIPTG